MDHGKLIEHSCKTPTKKTVHGLLTQQICYKTPPSRITKVKNPFEHVLREHLGTNFISPTLFTAKKPMRCSNDNNFTWTIDELARLKPAEIDEHTGNSHFESPERTDYCDSLTQSRIDTYFSMQQILPSPMQQACESVPLIKSEELSQLSPASHTTSHLPNVAHSYAQTVLTLPPTLPEEVERVLRPYYTFTENQQGSEVHEKSGLYQALFDAHEDDAEDEDYEDADSFSDVFSSPKMTAHSTQYQRTIGTPGNYDMINLCPMSPIKVVDVVEEVLRSPSPTGRGNFSQVMSVDGSFTVPDVEKMSCSQFDTSQTSTESLSTSAMNWDLEYKQMCSPITAPANQAAALAHALNTPKQRLLQSQRKKLSDSFGDDKPTPDSDDDDVLQQRFVIADSVDHHSESGYQTASYQSLPESGLVGVAPHATSRTIAADGWAAVDVVSSTPTKRKQYI